MFKDLPCQNCICTALASMQLPVNKKKYLFPVSLKTYHKLNTLNIYYAFKQFTNICMVSNKKSNLKNKNCTILKFSK